MPSRRLTADVALSQSLNHLHQRLVVVPHPGVVEMRKTLVLVLILVLQSENEPVVRISRSVDTVVDYVCEILVIVGWMYGINVVTAWWQRRIISEFNTQALKVITVMTQIFSGVTYHRWSSKEQTGSGWRWTEWRSCCLVLLDRGALAKQTGLSPAGSLSHTPSHTLG